MAMMGMEQRWKGLVRKAREFWADITEDETAGNKARTERELQTEEAVHQRYGGVRTAGERELSTAMKRERDENSMDENSMDESAMDKGPSDAILGNPAARAASPQLGGQRAGQQQMRQAQHQYTQQGGSSPKPLSEQMGETNETDSGQTQSRSSRRQNQ